MGIIIAISFRTEKDVICNGKTRKKLRVAAT